MCFKLWVFFALVNALYIGDALEANKTQEIHVCIFQLGYAHEHTE